MKKILHGLLLTILIGGISYVLAKYIPIGAVAIAIILGILVGNLFKIDEKYSAGITYSEKTVLAFAIALMGIDLNFTILSSLGLKTLLMIVLGMAVTIYSGVLIGRYYKLDTKLALLLGIGNGVCGSSAIGATSPIIKADKDSIGLSVAIVNLLGTFGIFLLPFIALTLGFNEIDSGILIGNTLQAVGQVTAAGFSIGDVSGISSTTVKMGRVLLLTPLVLILIYVYHKEKDESVHVAKFPMFIVFFVLFSIISSIDILNKEVVGFISTASHLALIVAMSGVGLKIHFSSIKNGGGVALKVATLVFVVQILFTGGFLLLF